MQPVVDDPTDRAIDHTGVGAGVDAGDGAGDGAGVDAGRRETLRDVVARLGERVAPLTLARERTLPLAEPVQGVFPERALVRGRVLSCGGAAASSIAFTVVRQALIEGAWLAAVDVAGFGADAANELGVPLERVVRIDTGVSDTGRHIGRNGSDDRRSADWIDVMGAAVDGFDIVLTRVPEGLRGDRRPASVRKLGTRVQQRGAVVIVLGDPGALATDVVLETSHTVWSGLGNGDGHLRCRLIGIEATGRRSPGVRTVSIELTGRSGRVDLAAAPPSSSEIDPPARVLAEMMSAREQGDERSRAAG